MPKDERPPAPTEQEVDNQLAAFEAWMVEEQKGGKLDIFERSILKTFLYWYWKVRS